MPKTVEIVEKAFKVAFDGDWNVALKWDDAPAYRDGIQKLVGSKAVDVIATRGAPQTLIMMIELKDFRGHRIENRSRITNGELFHEVGCKVRDTIAGLCGAARTRDDADLAKIAAKLTSTAELTVVLWLEEDPRARELPAQVRRKRGKTRLHTLTQELKRLLRWLRPRVIVCARGQSTLVDHGITVTAGRPRSDVGLS